MHKNNIIRVVSVVLAASMMLTVYGCKKSDNKTTGDINQPSVENNTAVINYTSVDNDGKETNVTNSVTVDNPGLNTVTVGSALSGTVKDESSMKDFLDKNDGYQIPDDKVQDITDNAAKWSEFTYNTYIANSNSKRICFQNLDVADTADIIINHTLDAMYSVGPGHGMTIVFSGLVNTAKYTDAEALQAALKDMKIKLQYTLLEGNATDLDDWSDYTTQAIDITIVSE